MILGLIPARADSRRLPRKNVASLGGMPLVVWTIIAAKASGIFSVIAVSTDDDEIKALARKHGVEVIERPAELCADNMPMLPVVRHALTAYPKTEVVMLLQPTSPFRDELHIREAMRQWRNASHGWHPKPSMASVDIKTEKENGAIYISAASVIREGGHIYDEAGGNWFKFHMDSFAASLDIDTPEDLEKAKALLARHEGEVDVKQSKPKRQ